MLSNLYSEALSEASAIFSSIPAVGGVSETVRKFWALRDKNESGCSLVLSEVIIASLRRTHAQLRQAANRIVFVSLGSAV